jgi:hypothetical protein
MSIADELAKLDALRKSGVLTKEEFDTAKAELLKPPSPTSTGTSWWRIGVILAVLVVGGSATAVTVLASRNSHESSATTTTTTPPTPRPPLLAGIIGTWTGSALGSTFCVSGDTKLIFGASGTFTEACGASVLWGVYSINPSVSNFLVPGTITFHFAGSSPSGAYTAGTMKVQYGFFCTGMCLDNANGLHLTDSRGTYTLNRQ